MEGVDRDALQGRPIGFVETIRARFGLKLVGYPSFVARWRRDRFGTDDGAAHIRRLASWATRSRQTGQFLPVVIR